MQGVMARTDRMLNVSSGFVLPRLGRELCSALEFGESWKARPLGTVILDTNLNSIRHIRHASNPLHYLLSSSLLTYLNTSIMIDCWQIKYPAG